MALDERYGCNVSSESQVFSWEIPTMRPEGCCYTQHPTGRSFYGRSRRRFRPEGRVSDVWNLCKESRNEPKTEEMMRSEELRHLTNTCSSHLTLSSVVSKRRATPHPKSSNRPTAVAAEDFATPGPDRVRQECAPTGLQIPLERQLGESVVSLGSHRSTAFAIGASKFLEIEALRAEYQNPLMGESKL